MKHKWKPIVDLSRTCAICGWSESIALEVQNCDYYPYECPGFIYEWTVKIKMKNGGRFFYNISGIPKI